MNNNPSNPQQPIHSLRKTHAPVSHVCFSCSLALRHQNLTTYEYITNKREAPSVEICESKGDFGQYFCMTYPLVMTNIAMENSPFIDGI